MSDLLTYARSVMTSVHGDWTITTGSRRGDVAIARELGTNMQLKFYTDGVKKINVSTHRPFGVHQHVVIDSSGIKYMICSGRMPDDVASQINDDVLPELEKFTSRMILRARRTKVDSQFDDFVYEIVKCLGGSWELSTNNNYAITATRFDRVGLFFRYTLPDEKKADGWMTISGSYPRSLSGQYMVTATELPSMGCNAGRKPQSIAKSINQRILEDVVKITKSTLANIKAEEDREMESIHIVSEICQACNGGINPHSSNGTVDRIHSNRDSLVQWVANLVSTRINLKIDNLTKEEMIYVIRCLESRRVGES